MNREDEDAITERRHSAQACRQLLTDRIKTALKLIDNFAAEADLLQCQPEQPDSVPRMDALDEMVTATAAVVDRATTSIRACLRTEFGLPKTLVDRLLMNEVQAGARLIKIQDEDVARYEASKLRVVDDEDQPEQKQEASR